MPGHEHRLGLCPGVLREWAVVLEGEKCQEIGAKCQEIAFSDHYFDAGYLARSCRNMRSKKRFTTQPSLRGMEVVVPALGPTCRPE